MDRMPSALILRSRAAASRRRLQEAPATTDASFETRSCEALLRMRTEGIVERSSGAPKNRVSI
jgi:hypothetical protein